MTWRLAPGVVRLSGGRLAGGVPFRVVRLSESGSATLQAHLGRNGPADPRFEPLAGRLIRYGLLLGPARGAAAVEDVTVVVPALSDPGPVAALLRAVPPKVPVIVVDDGSPVPLRPALGKRAGWRVLRHDQPRGPGAARNAGAAAADTTWIAFVDADIVLTPGWLGRLLGLVGDGTVPEIVAVGPRVVSQPEPGLAGFLEQWSGALDLGATPSDVGPGRPVSYLPAATLLVHRETFLAAGGFAEDMMVGEDVDLIWRLAGEHRVRYEPDVVVQHRPRRGTGAVLRRRFAYGTSAGPLARRHPQSLAHADVSAWSFVPWLLGIVVHPAVGLLTAAAGVAAAPYAPGLRELPAADARRLARHGHTLAAEALGRWLVRPLWPVTLALAVLVPRRRRVLAAAVAIGLPALVRRRVRVSPAGDGAAAGAIAAATARTIMAGLGDDIAYSAGVWAGSARARTPAPLLPRVRFRASDDRPAAGRRPG